ncbi:M48 family metallopeptidase [Halorubrum sp. CGM5_25_10-8B]|uniref:M48 family metallopeptidase n=1 Tax=Halorubrum sp. CGM5_25_10-8B TaxID=2518115 RepID=UPI001F54661B|nr:YgjP-like metallopeptidase domain-containing protein [Halorubrum sp. CGM5_25_10-8B]
MSTQSQSVTLPTGDKITYSIDERDVLYPRLTLNPDGTLAVIVPPETPGHTVVANEQEWIASKYESQQNDLTSILDKYGIITENFTLWGKSYILQERIGQHEVKIESNRLILTAPPDYSAVNYLKKKIKQALATAIETIADSFCQQLNQDYEKITIRSQRTKWASCSGQDTLNFNLRCAFLPITHLQYLVAHEVTHLVEQTHNKNFWEVLRSFLPDYETVKNELQGFWYAVHHNSQWMSFLDTSHP